MKFLERYREERQKRGTINLQFIYLPEEHDPSYAGVLKELTPNFFKPSPDKNTLVIQAPFLLGGLDLPHFNYWVGEAGNYFDGFRQHCATSGSGQPLSQENLNLIRNNYQTAYERNFQGLAWEFDQKEGHERFEGQEYTSMLAILYVLDQLPKEKSVSLAVQPVTAKDLGSFVIRNRKLIWGKELSGQEIKPTEDVDEYLQANRPDIVEYYSRLGKAAGDKVLPFVAFVNRTLDEALQRPGNTNMLVLMDDIGHPLSYTDFQNRAGENPSIKLREAKFLNCGGYYPDP